MFVKYGMLIGRSVTPEADSRSPGLSLVSETQHKDKLGYVLLQTSSLFVNGQMNLSLFVNNCMLVWPGWVFRGSASCQTSNSYRTYPQLLLPAVEHMPACRVGFVYLLNAL